jgi:hypothetical protein
MNYSFFILLFYLTIDFFPIFLFKMQIYDEVYSNLNLDL